MNQAKEVSKQGLVMAIGDMNLDVERFEDPDYYLKPISDQYQLDLGEGGFDIINFGLTWKSRTAVDHCFINKPEAMKKHGQIPIDSIYSDHSLIYVELEAQIKKRKLESFQCRDMRKIRSNPSYFVNALLRYLTTLKGTMFEKYCLAF